MFGVKVEQRANEHVKDILWGDDDEWLIHTTCEGYITARAGKIKRMAKKITLTGTPSQHVKETVTLYILTLMIHFGISLEDIMSVQLDMRNHIK